MQFFRNPIIFLQYLIIYMGRAHWCFVWDYRIWDFNFINEFVFFISDLEIIAFVFDKELKIQGVLECLFIKMKINIKYKVGHYAFSTKTRHCLIIE